LFALDEKSRNVIDGGCHDRFSAGRRPGKGGVWAMSGKPSHKVFVVEDVEKECDDNDAFWTRIGSAWSHKDGKGLNLVLSALPINGRLVLREYTPDDEKKDVEKVTRFRKK
jgi:hypothetical protein